MIDKHLCLFVNKLVARHEKLNEVGKSTDVAMAQRAWARRDEIQQTLVMFYEIAADSSKFKNMKLHIRTAIETVNPAYASGYFKPIKKVKRP